jgi:hypothetical protein
MSNVTKSFTNYFRIAVTAQANMGIDFKTDRYQIISAEELVQGEIHPAACEAIFAEDRKQSRNDEREAKKIF